ncbi:hypothetical protein Nepgr_031825 [Nepenthes gracilis]|uniref:Uncharacterized protein n=1 Tax=Nepenthes gracilis TaxID=150966 RepID=A0AAD3Y558_NEPGR|nr:hypothetical protein Nepgr_031825 [Nepenthes gracilis]
MLFDRYVPSKVRISNPACPEQSFTEINIDYQWKLVHRGNCQKLGHGNCKTSKLYQPTVSSSGSIHSFKTCRLSLRWRKFTHLESFVWMICRLLWKEGVRQVKKIVEDEDELHGLGKLRKNIEEIKLQLGASRAKVPELEDDVGMSGYKGFDTENPSPLSVEGLSPTNEGGGSQSCLKKLKRSKRNTLLLLLMIAEVFGFVVEVCSYCRGTNSGCS